MTLTWHDHQSRLDSARLELGHNPVCLINLHQLVGVVLDEQRVGIPLRNTSNGCDFAKPLIFCLAGKTPKPILISIVMAEIERC